MYHPRCLQVFILLAMTEWTCARKVVMGIISFARAARQRMD